jgi:type IV pilus assembly protein PilA
MVCANCGATLSSRLSFCTNCGAAIPAPGTPAPVRPAAPIASPAAPAGAAADSPRPDVKAIFSLILGILALVPFSILAGIPAIVLGHISKSSVRDSQGRLTGSGMATAGLVMGYLSIFLLIAAIAIPNLIRARMAPGESPSIGSVRTINTAQVTYATTYPERGFARDLATLGEGGVPNCTSPTPEHACLLDNTLGAPTCTGGTWCFKSGYRFSVVAICPQDACTDYVVTATPAESGRTYCSTSDAVIRYIVNTEPLAAPLADPQICKAWIPLS